MPKQHKLRIGINCAVLALKELVIAQTRPECVAKQVCYFNSLLPFLLGRSSSSVGQYTIL